MIAVAGAPLDIPSLTYDALVKFHHRHYHPSNSKFFTYGKRNEKPVMRTECDLDWNCYRKGDMSLEPQLRQIDECIKQFPRIDPKTEVPLEQRYTVCEYR
jgi:Zn-dependent M16 (insulinase) family peptidase